MNGCYNAGLLGQCECSGKVSWISGQTVGTRLYYSTSRVALVYAAMSREDGGSRWATRSRSYVSRQFVVWRS